DSRAGQALGKLALKAGDDPYLLATAMSSINKKNLGPVMRTVLAERTHPGPHLTEDLLRMSIALDDKLGLAELLRQVSRSQDGKYAAWQFAALASLFDALEQLHSSLTKLEESGDADLKEALHGLNGLFEAARMIASNKTADVNLQLEALRLLARDPDHLKQDRDLLASLLSLQTPPEIQEAAVESLARSASKGDVSSLLLRNWKAYSPKLRGQVLEVLFRREDGVRAVLQALQEKQILAADIDAPRRQRLLQHKNPALRDQAAKLLAFAVNPDRQKVVEAYQSVLKLKGDPAHGQQVFTKTCATCHRYRDVGLQVGPDLASVGDKSPLSLLTAVLDPNQAVEARYVSYLATTKNGLTCTGIPASD